MVGGYRLVGLENLGFRGFLVEGNFKCRDEFEEFLKLCF